MKRNIFVFSAILMAVFFSAFKFAGNEPSSKYADLYWYEVEPNGAIDHTATVNGGVAVSKAYLEAHTSLLPCTIQAGTDCVRGFTAAQTSDVSSGQTAFIQKAQ